MRKGRKYDLTEGRNIGLRLLNGYVSREEPCTDPYARCCGQTEATASSLTRYKIKGHPTRRQVIWSQCSDPLLGRDEDESGRRRHWAVALSFCRLLGLGCPKQAFVKIATPRCVQNIDDALYVSRSYALWPLALRLSSIANCNSRRFLSNSNSSISLRK